MSEHKVWAVVDEKGEYAGGTITTKDPVRTYLAAGFRFVEATLVIPDEPEWTVITHDDGSVEVLRGPAKRSGRDPDFYDRCFGIRAPDAMTALKRALEQRR